VSRNTTRGTGEGDHSSWRVVRRKGHRAKAVGMEVSYLEGLPIPGLLKLLSLEWEKCPFEPYTSCGCTVKRG
jgi:hypothetical protein